MPAWFGVVVAFVISGRAPTASEAAGIAMIVLGPFSDSRSAGLRPTAGAVTRPNATPFRSRPLATESQPHPLAAVTVLPGRASRIRDVRGARVLAVRRG